MLLDLTDLPPRVMLNEVGPRDGFQNQSRVLDTALKLDIIAGLVAAGLHEIQVTSFVHPGKVPQTADADTLAAGLPPVEGVVYSALALNLRGVQRAAAAGIGAVEISLSVSDAHSLANAGRDHRQALAEGCRMIRQAKSFGLQVIASLQCAFGYQAPSDIDPQQVVAAARMLLAEGPLRLTLADTTGMADPLRIAGLLESIGPLAGNIPLALHLHDTRGLGLINLITGLCRGIVHFDTALGGMGGCPFIAGAAGNIPTEDTAFLLGRMGIDTGVDIESVARLSRQLEKIYNTRFAGRLHRLRPS